METKDSDVTQTIIAIYALHLTDLGAFYKEALDLEELESGDDYVCLGRNGIEVNILKMNSKPGMKIEPEMSMHIREENPVKCSFIVQSFEQARKAHQKFGGKLQDEKNAWEWRGAKHLDGYDPEGNVLQYRVMI